MRALVLLSAFVLVLPIAAAGDDGTEPDNEPDCFPVIIDAIPPNEVQLNVPCAAENVSSVMPAGGDVVLCTFYSIWNTTAREQQGVPTAGLAGVHVETAADCITG